MFTSIGYHTFVISKNLTQEEAEALWKSFKQYRNNTGEIYIEGPCEYDKDPFARHFEIKYVGKYKGIWWKMRFSSRGFCVDNDFKPCSIKAVINPKILSEQKSYIVAAKADSLEKVRECYDHEAAKISPILGGFYNYSLNRIDYCINFDVSELKCGNSLELKEELPKRIMQLIKWSDIPDKYHEEYREENQFYLKSDSVVVNCYWKYAELKKDFPNCKDIKKSYDIIRFEVQFKYPKVSTVLRSVRKEITYQRRQQMKEWMNLRGFEFHEKQSTADEERAKKLTAMREKVCLRDEIVIMRRMLSDEECSDVIEKYFSEIIKHGDYYTFDTAKRMIEAKTSSWDKAVRLTDALKMIRDSGGITRAKKTLQKKELETFRRSLRELAKLKINPVTFPNEWGIEHIPNLLDNYYLIRAEERERESEKQFYEEICRDYIRDCRKKGKTWWKF